jgi:HAD superfamily hydrolase (TIGR01509 family)
MIGAVPKALDVAMIDVGGTLWPNSWPFRETDGVGRHQRVGAAMPMLDAVKVDALVADLIASSRIGDEARAISTETPTTIAAAEVLIATSLTRQGLPADDQTVARIRALGLRTVIASNTYWRDAESYWEDFRLLGMAGYIDAIVTSVDAGHLKPHPAVFEMAMRVAGTPPERCVVIGNREENDIEPALALGMKTILVHPDDPKPASSRAHAVAPDLWECAKALRAMLGA